MGVKPTERMWYTADRDRLVPASDPAAAYQAPKEFTEEEAKRLGVKPAGIRNAPVESGDGLDQLTVPVLTEQAKALGVNTKDLKKAELIEAIRAKHAAPEGSDNGDPEQLSGEQGSASQQGGE